MREMFRVCLSLAWLFVLPLLGQASTSAARAADFSLAQALDYPYVDQLAAAEQADAIAWVSNIDGVRNIWVARGPNFSPMQVTRYTEDDGQELTQLTFSPDGSRLVFVRGGDHDANWPAEGNLAPDPSSAPEQPVVEIWSVSFTGGAPTKLADGDAPVISASGKLAFIKDNQVWSVPLEGGTAERLFFDRGKDRDLRWSPDGSKLAFVSGRGDHAFIGIYSGTATPLEYLAPSTGLDGSPRWSADGTHVAFTRQPGEGGAPEPLLTQVPHPWSLWIGSIADGSGRQVWQSPRTLAGSYPDIEGEANLHWMGDRLVFTAYLDEWPHLYSIPTAGGTPTLLTPGVFMVEHVAESRDHRFVIYDANTGTTAGDLERRHVFRVAVDHAGSTALTSGDTLEWTPVSAAADRVAFVAAGTKQVPTLGLVNLDGTKKTLVPSGVADYPSAQFVVPKSVTFTAADGVIAHGQLFESGAAKSGASKPKPAVIFVIGGPPRQMLLGWHYMDYYSNAYAVNQYLATHGFVVLSVNYRLGIGYGRAFHQPEHAGFAGAAEYQDVVAGARFLQALPGVDGQRIGIWGGSYGGYLTALALARNAEIFKAGVDLHGVHDWSRLLDDWVGKGASRYEKGDREKAMEVAWNSSPDASIEGWRGPVLLIQGDDDRNVPFQQTVDLARRLDARGVRYEELVIPNEIHGFLRHASWLRVDEATVDFLTRNLAKR